MSYNANEKNTSLQADQESKLLEFNRQSERQSDRAKLCCSKRLLIVFFVAIGYMSLISLRTNLSIAIVEMTRKNSSSENETSNNAEFDWDSQQKGFALSAFSYGYMFAPIGGILASRIGGATVFGIGVALTAFTTLSTPFLVHTNFYLFIATRILEGISEAFSMASAPEIWSRWAPTDERATMTGFSGVGYLFGSMIYFPLNGFIAKMWGWPSIFYFTGTVPLIWSTFWFLFVSNDPAEDKYISDGEKEYLKKNIHRKLKDKVDYSIKSIFTSKPMWALWFLKITTSCGYTFIYIYLPQYIKDIITDIDITQVGFISAIPHLCSFCSSPLISLFADYLRSKTRLSRTRVHKLFACVGHVGMAILFVAITFTNFTGSIVCVCLITISGLFVEVVIDVSLLDMAPRYASLLWGINNVFFTLGAILTPTYIGHVVTSHNVSEWNTCFLTFSGLYAFAISIYLIFGSGKLQTWSLHPDDKYEQFVKK